MTGCSPPVNDQDAAEAFGSMDGVVATRAGCSQPLPFTYSCTIDVTVAREVSEEQLVAVLAQAREVNLRGTLTVSSESISDADSVVSIENADLFGEETRVAKIFVATLPILGLQSLRIGFVNNDDRDVLVDARFPTVDDGELISAASEISAILPSVHLTLRTERFTFSSTGEFPSDEVALYAAIGDTFPVLGGAIQPGYVEVQVDPSADLAAAKTFAAEQPEYDRISTVALSNDDSVEVRDVDAASSASVLAVTDAARELSEFDTATVRGALVDFTVDEATDARTMDSALRRVPEYDELSIRYSMKGFSITRAVGREFFFDVWEALAADPVIISASIAEYTDDFGDFHVKIDGAQNTAPYDLGVALGASGLPRMPSTSIIIGVRGDDGLYSTSFIAGDTISLKTDQWLNNKQAAALKQGWVDGQR